MNKNRYKLGNFVITEYDRLLFTWESHIAIGGRRSGNCFIFGDILVIDKWDNEDAGYLILEFQEQLKKIPIWDKTRYFCLSSDLKDVKTGRKPILFKVQKDETINKNVKILEPGLFRLAQYKLMVEQNNNILWQAYGGANKIKGGKCVLYSGILFIGPKEFERYESQDKKVWRSELRSIPQWDKTVAWGHLKILQGCYRKKEPKQLNEYFWNSEAIINPIIKNISFSKKKKLNIYHNLKMLSSSINRLKVSKFNFSKLKEWWDHFLPSLINVLILCINVFLFLLKKIVYWCCKAMKHLQKYTKKGGNY